MLALALVALLSLRIIQANITVVSQGPTRSQSAPTSNRTRNSLSIGSWKRWSWSSSSGGWYAKCRGIRKNSRQTPMVCFCARPSGGNENSCLLFAGKVGRKTSLSRWKVGSCSFLFHAYSSAILFTLFWKIHQ